jgi:LCP family protein required for cell wall assembly
LPSKPVEELIVDGVVNIMLIGEDRRPGQGRQRSDSMILCSFNKNNNSITMISFLRDTYVAIPGHDHNKLNAAYQFGGPNLLDQTLATNFGVHVDANIMIDFDGFKGIIDMLGGVDIKLTAKEAKHLNSQYGWNLTEGVNHLDGERALGYSRIRKIDMDAMRAQRQRKVLTALINSYKNKSVAEMVSLASDILQTGFIKTDMTSQEVVSYVMSLFPMLSKASINNQQIPANNTYSEYSVGSLTYCKLPDLEINRKILKNIFTQG